MGDGVDAHYGIYVPRWWKADISSAVLGRLYVAPAKATFACLSPDRFRAFGAFCASWRLERRAGGASRPNTEGSCASGERGLTHEEAMEELVADQHLRVFVLD
jgi:hypothetical protein